ncbi:hypothetical protein BGX21_001316 [Mortierella sp. AD011]|nr:hypothetical protein BGX20_000645 [Mortierella sp. AD010]KAF9384368.1 hypothetical protein BGX21_001316 [Mortierella sp. AD011]
MFRLLARAAALAVLTLNLLGTTDADGSVANYNGTLCKDYINYQVWVPPGASISTIEADLIQKGLTDQTLKLISSSCLNPFMEYICTSSFPKVTQFNSRLRRTN